MVPVILSATAALPAAIASSFDTSTGRETTPRALPVSYTHLQMLLQLLSAPRAVQQEGTAVNQLLNHIVLAHIGRVMACYEVGLLDQVCRLDLLVAKTQDVYKRQL